MEGTKPNPRRVARQKSNPRTPHNPLIRRQLTGMLRIALLLLGGAVALLLLILILHPSNQYFNSPEIQRARRVGVLRVGVLTNAEGFSANEDGLEVELARALCKRIFPELDPGATLELVSVNANTALPKLNNNTVDILFARQRALDSGSYTYSGSYYSEAIKLLCRPGDEAIALDNQVVGLIDGSAEKSAWASYVAAHENGLKAKYYPAYQDMCIALKNGNIRLIAVPASQIPLLSIWGFSEHQTQLGAASYVAVSSLEAPGFALMADLIIRELERDGTLNAMISQYGLLKYKTV